MPSQACTALAEHAARRSQRQNAASPLLRACSQTLEPQPGFSLANNLLDALGLLPTSLPPFGSLTAAFLLSPDAGSAPEHAPLPAKLAPSALVVDYSVDSKQQCGVAAVPLGPVGTAARGAASGGSPTAAAARGLEQTPDADALELLGSAENGSPRKGAVAAAAAAATGPASSGAGGDSPTSTANAGEAAVGGAGSDRQHCCFRHRLTLELPSSESATDGERERFVARCGSWLGPWLACLQQHASVRCASQEGRPFRLAGSTDCMLPVHLLATRPTGALVLVRLLGPFVATLGQPTTLCWRLERSGPPAAAGGSEAQEVPAAVPASRIAFEVLTEVS